MEIGNRCGAKNHESDEFGSGKPLDTWNPSCIAEGANETLHSRSTVDRQAREDRV